LFKKNQGVSQHEKIKEKNQGVSQHDIYSNLLGRFLLDK